jgi:hypothetical protein
MIVRRAEALSEMWSGSFMDEAALLLPVSAAERAVFTREPVPVPAQRREQELYTAASEAFHASEVETSDTDLAGPVASRDRQAAVAEKAFVQLLKLPAATRARTSVAAAYSLGRIRAFDYDTALAIAAFRQVRALAKAGFVDPDHLAIASLGEEARLLWRQRDDIVGAFHLYAQQASLDESGALSLIAVLRYAEPKDRAVLGRDAMGARLLALYFYTRSEEIGDDERAAWSRDVARSSTTEARGADYAAAAAYRAGDWKSAERLAAVCHHSPVAMWVQAKLALRDGNRARAEALLAQVEKSRLVDQDSPATKVRGELGLLALADEHFPEAMQWFAKGKRVVEAAYVAERVLTLDEMQRAVVSTAEQRRAVDLPKVARPPADDEAPADDEPVETGVAAALGASSDADEGADETADSDQSSPDEKPEYLPGCNAWELDSAMPSSCWPRRLLAMYSRRLIRERRYDDALEAFGHEVDENVSADAEDGAEAGPPDTSSLVQFAADAQHYLEHARAAVGATGIERAEQLFASATVMRDRGMEIAGTETGPDWRVYDGSFSRSLLCLPSPTGGYEKYATETEVWDGDEDSGCVAPTREDAALVSAAEVTRVRASEPPGKQRFAYRIVASQLAEQAAELVPPRSQAYGALLCFAAKYASRDQDRFEALYAKFLRNGASGAGGDAFGSECPDPELGRARTFDADQARARVDQALADQLAELQRHAWTVERVKHAALRRKRWAGIPLGLVAAFLALYVARRARRRRATLGTWGR